MLKCQPDRIEELKVEHSCIIYDADDHEDFIVSDELQIEYYE